MCNVLRHVTDIDEFDKLMKQTMSRWNIEC